MPRDLTTVGLLSGITLASMLAAGTARGESAVVVRLLADAATYSPTNPPHQWSPDGNSLVYLLDAADDWGPELFSVGRDGGTPVRLSAEMPFAERPTAFLVTPDSQTVLFVGPNELEGTRELYAVPLGGPAAAAVRLHQPLPPGTSVRDELALTPDGARVLFIADLEASGHRELWSVPIDGSELPVRLSSGSMVAGGQVEPPVKLSPDGTRVVFRADAAVDGRLELWSAPADGSAAPVRLNTPFGSGSRARDFAITSNGRVIFLADPTAGRTELWAAPLAGPAAAAIRLNAPLGSSREVTSFALVLDDRRVVYRADGVVNDIFRLYRVSVDGSPAAAEISAGMQANGSVTTWAASPDGSFVAYVADATTDEAYGVWSLTMDPLGAPVRLSPAFAPAGGDVESLAITRDSRKVVYRGDMSTNGTPSLYSVNPDATSRRTLAHFASGDDITFSLTPDSLRAVVRKNVPQTTGMGSYSWLRLDGSDAAPVSLLPPGASVHFSAASGVASPDGRAFAYRRGDGVSVWGLYVAKRSFSDGPLIP